MLTRVAIINRGEAALRFIRAAREYALEQGIKLQTVALVTPPDQGALFAREADQVVQLGPTQANRAAAAYLDADRVLDAVRIAGADAVWVGWGFVAEDADFAQRAQDQGLTFIGPSPGAMRAAGDKVAAKQLAEQCGVPVVPWSQGPVESAHDAQQVAQQIGYPVALKAAAGGGGRGIRVVHRPAELEGSLESARREALGAFGDDRMFVERCVTRARHVEVQIAVDCCGHGLALGVRDCSLQRRHQKIIEECPGPAMTAQLAQRLEQGALSLAQACGYRNVGTVEFLLDLDSGEAYFMEINARLQVEHPITELVHGLDLVKLQLEIARGRCIKDHPIAPRGYAMELRLNAEDPDQGFAPAPGRVLRMTAPSGPGVRVDAGVEQGSVVPSDFDSMVAKLIVHGADRAEVLARARRALAETSVLIEDGATNMGLLTALLSDAEFVAGKIDTAWLDRKVNRGAFTHRPRQAEALIAAAILAYRAAERSELANFYAAVARGVPRSLPATKGRQVELSLRNARHQLEVFCLGQGEYRVYPGSATDGGVTGPGMVASLEEEGRAAARLVLGGERLSLLYSQREEVIQLELEGVAHRISRDAGGNVCAPAPSMVLELSVEVGDVVQANQRLGSLEAMKMEIALMAPRGGRVSAIFVQPNTQVAAGQPLLALEATDQEEAEQGPQGEPLSWPAATDQDQQQLTALLATAPEDLPARLRALEPAARQALAAALVAELRQIFLGYDVDQHRLELMTRLLSAEDAWAEVSHCADFRELGQALVIFVDTQWMLSPQLLPARDGHPTLSVSSALFEYMRRVNSAAQGAHPELVPLLRRVLAHHGIDSLEPTPRLRRALARLAGAHAEQHHMLCSALMRALNALHRAGADFSADMELRQALERLPLVARDQWPYLADNAHQTRYVMFSQPRFERREQEHRQHVRQALDRAAHPKCGASERASLIEQLARAPQAVFPQLGPAACSGELAAQQVALEALLRRSYGPAEFLRLTARQLQGVPVLRALVRQEALVREVLVAACPAEQLDRAIGALAAPRSDLGVDAAAVADLYLLGTTDQLHQAQQLLADIPGAGRRLKRLCLTLVNGDPLPPQRTLVAQEASGFVEARQLRQLHPEMERRLELWRLSEFKLRRLASHERLVVYQGTARDNPRDERIFVLGEVGSVPAGQPVASATASLLAFEHAYLEAVRALREIQSRRTARRRYHWNRVTLFVRPVVCVSQQAVAEVAGRLASYTHGLGLERVVVRLPLVDPAAPQRPARQTEIRVSNTSGHKLEVSFAAPSPRPLRAASPYELKVQKARSLGLAYPYEVIRMLTRPPQVPSLPGVGFPAGRFTEYDLQPGIDGELRAVPLPNRPHGDNEAGLVWGVISHATAKHPEGMQRVIVLSDPLKGMGALAAPECQRIIAALELAQQRGLPLEWVPISSGARIAMDSGTENLDWTARALRRIIEFTQAGGEINVIVDGVNVGAQSYFNAEATMLMHTRGVLIMTPRGAMVLTGKRALDFSGGVSAKDERGIGGHERIMGRNGQAQYFARDLADAFRLLLEHYSFTYIAPGERRVRPQPSADPMDRDPCAEPYQGHGDEAFHTVGDLFSAEHNPERKKPFSMRALMRAVADRDGGQLERFAQMRDAETAIAWDCHLGGQAVSMIGFESRPLPRLGLIPGDGPESWTGGTLFPRSSKKVARAINAASGNRPVVVLANLSGFDGSPESMRRLQLEYGAEIGRAVVNFGGPLLFCVVARYHGGAYVVFSKALNEQLVSLAVEGSFASVIGGAPAAAVVFPREVRARAEADPRLLEARRRLEVAPAADHLRRSEELSRVHAVVHADKQGEVAREFDAVHSVQRACEVGSLDQVIEASRLRQALCQALARAAAAHGGPHGQQQGATQQEKRAHASS